MDRTETYDETTIKLMAMTDEELDRYKRATIEYMRGLDPDSPKLGATKALLSKIREESERRGAKTQYRPASTSAGAAPKPKKKKGRGCLTGVLIAVVCVIALAVIGAIFGGDDEPKEQTPSSGENVSNLDTSPEEPEKGPEAATISVDTELGSGNYIVGTDIPAGKYDIIAVSGGGNVSSSNMYFGGINAMMGVAEENKGDHDLYEQEYKNIDLPDGVRLSVSGGVVIRITCDKASGKALVPRNQDITESITLGNGNYVAGEDFPAGVYDLSAVSGGGNVSSDNMFEGGINALLGSADQNSEGWQLYEQEYKHVILPEGVTLSVSGLELLLTPSK